MKHFAADQWADFVRRVAAPDLRDAMHQHIEAGCERCVRLHNSLREIADFAATERSLEVPAAILRRARALLSAWMPERILSQPRIFPSLVLDTLLQPAPVGTRVRDAVGRQVLYRAGRYLLDLHQEREPGRGNVTLVGQLVDSEDPRRQFPDVPALLFSGRSVVARALTNEFGEFQMEYRPRRALELVLALEGETASVTLAGVPTTHTSTAVKAARRGVAVNRGKGQSSRRSP